MTLRPAPSLILSATLFAALAAVNNLQAQQQVNPPAAPVPPQVVNAKRVFISNAFADNGSDFNKYVGGPNGIYDQFYANVKNLGRYELVTAPADSDVVFEVTMVAYPGGAIIPRMRLAILDPKSNVLLWTITEPIGVANLAGTARKHIAVSLAKLTDDLKNVGTKP